MIIKPYLESRDYAKIADLFETEKDWSCYTSKDNAKKYKESLSKSITYVAYEKDMLIGYSRSIEDFNFYIYICDLLVQKSYRGKNTGKELMECLLQDFPEHEIFVMSDVDEYYKKLNYKIEGTIFKIPKK